MTVFIDADFRCHVTDDGTMTAVETDFFEGKCAAFIEGYRHIPAGASWKRPDGKVFLGEMTSPWKPYAQLVAVQAQYEQDLADRADLEAGYNYLLTGGADNG